jgi:hypothetical protein
MIKNCSILGDLKKVIFKISFNLKELQMMQIVGIKVAVLLIIFSFLGYEYENW